MSAQHTQGLMKVHTENADGWPLLMIGGRIVANVNAESGVDTAKAPSIAFKPMPAEANARRLVACWNAFDGLETEMVESMVNVPAFFFKHTELLTQRDYLLEALKALVDGLDRTTWSSWQTTAYFSDQHEAARAAIAKVTGSPT